MQKHIKIAKNRVNHSIEELRANMKEANVYLGANITQANHIAYLAICAAYYTRKLDNSAGQWDTVYDMHMKKYKEVEDAESTSNNS